MKKLSCSDEKTKKQLTFCFENTMEKIHQISAKNQAFFDLKKQ